MPDLVVTILIGCALLGAVSGVIGSFAVLRRRALMGDLLSHAALPGLCLAFLDAGYEREYSTLLIGALISGMIGVGLVTLLIRWTRTKEDAAIGIVLSTFFGFGIVLLSIIQRMPGGGGKSGLERYTLGQAANMSDGDVITIAIVSVAVMALVALLYKEFKVFSFDPDFARSQGWPTLLLDLVMMGTLGLVAVVGVKAVGVLLVPALLITPGAAARFWTNRLETMLVLSGVLGLITGAVGTFISSGLLTEWLEFDPLAFGTNQKALPTGPVIVLTGTVIFLFSMVFAPQRGILARWLLRLQTNRKIARENLLRTLYELNESALPQMNAISPEQLKAERAWSDAQLGRLLHSARRAGWIVEVPLGVQMTPAGLSEAARITRTHRLWELFLIQGANIASDHVDRDADAIEHVLPPEMVDDLEAALAAQGRLPAQFGQVPKSPHELSKG
ncbi:MAG: metal ABC transporter permease [Planctomycetota bacterium]|nr:metal ABC transporter permease [Planctomycetota bacterium]